jgi:hypothetical protein
MTRHEAIMYCIENYMKVELLSINNVDEIESYFISELTRDNDVDDRYETIVPNADKTYDEIDNYMLIHLIDLGRNLEDESVDFRIKILQSRKFLSVEKYYLEEDAKCAIIPEYLSERINKGKLVSEAITTKNVKAFCKLLDLEYDYVSNIMYYKKYKEEYLRNCGLKKDQVLINRYTHS